MSLSEEHNIIVDKKRAATPKREIIESFIIGRRDFIANSSKGIKLAFLQRYLIFSQFALATAKHVGYHVSIIFDFFTTKHIFVNLK